MSRGALFSSEYCPGGQYSRGGGGGGGNIHGGTLFTPTPAKNNSGRRLALYLERKKFYKWSYGA